MAPQVADPSNGDSGDPLLLLRDSLVAFRGDLDDLFQAQQRHNVTRRRLQDLYVRLLWSSHRTEPESSSVGIAGIGKLSDDSPNSKGARAKRHSLGLAGLGGEDELRNLVLQFLALDEPLASGKLTQESIQDIWADELSGASARVSALIRRDGMSSDCRQFALVKDGLRP